MPTESKQIKLLFFTLLATLLPSEELWPILRSLSEVEKLRLMFYCQKHLREGAWKILDLFETEMPPAWRSFIALLRAQYYDPDFLWQGNHLKTVVSQIEAHASKQVEEIAKILPQVIEAMIAYPSNGLKTIAKMQGSLPASKLTQMQQQMKETASYIEKIFAPYRFQSYSQQEWISFFPASMALKGT